MNKKQLIQLYTNSNKEGITLRDLPTLRQAFFVASSLIIVAFMLAKIAHPDWIYLALLPAFGLMFSAVVGVCPMIVMLQLLPWNQSSR